MVLIAKGCAKQVAMTIVLSLVTRTAPIACHAKGAALKMRTFRLSVRRLRRFWKIRSRCRVAESLVRVVVARYVGRATLSSCASVVA